MKTCYIGIVETDLSYRTRTSYILGDSTSSANSAKFHEIPFNFS
jgi:hypothetical protein